MSAVPHHERAVPLITSVVLLITRAVHAITRKYRFGAAGHGALYSVPTQLPWKPFGTRSGRCTAPTVSSVPASKMVRSLFCVAGS